MENWTSKYNYKFEQYIGKVSQYGDGFILTTPTGVRVPFPTDRGKLIMEADQHRAPAGRPNTYAPHIRTKVVGFLLKDSTARDVKKYSIDSKIVDMLIESYIQNNIIAREEKKNNDAQEQIGVPDVAE